MTPDIDNVEQKRFFCFGYGYTANYLGHALQTEEQGWTIGGTIRDEDRQRDLLSRRIRARIFDENHAIADPTTLFNRFTHLLISTPPSVDGDLVFNTHAEDFIGLKNLKWVGYLSSTNVYGDRDGADVTENSEVAPTSARGSKRALAERQWLSLYEQHGVPVHIFRLSGIYGPGRSAIDSVRAGVARCIDKPGHKFNRIHVEDIVQVLRKSIENPNPGSIYNVSDDLPAPSYDVIQEACKILKQPKPEIVPYNEADLAPITASFYNDNKVVINDKMKSELGVQLKYPDYRVGLKGCLDAEETYFKEQNLA